MPDAAVGQDALPVSPAPVRKRSGNRLSLEEKAARAEARKLEAARVREETAKRKADEKAAAKAAKLAETEGGHVELPALVLRDGSVYSIELAHIPVLLEPYMGGLSVDIENSGYDLGHELYELRTVQLGGEDAVVVLDAANLWQMMAAREALKRATRLYSFSASVEGVALVVKELISWDDYWGKVRDGVLYAKVIDPKLSGSSADGLKDLSRDMLRDRAVAPAAEKAKNAMFQAMGCLIQTDNTTPPERNGWYQVKKTARTMIVYAGSDVLDLAACVRLLEPQIPVTEEVLDRETAFQKACSRVKLDGFHLNQPHIEAKIEEYEGKRTEAQHNVFVLSGGRITNPSSPKVIESLQDQFPGVPFVAKDKLASKIAGETVWKDSAAKEVLAKVSRTENQVLKYVCEQILEYRHCVTTKGLLLEPLLALCNFGDNRMRPTVYTINADTGRTSCVRPNGQQFSRQGGIRACVDADEGMEGIAADFTGCEIRVAAGLSGDRGLLEAETSSKCWNCRTFSDPFTGEPCDCGRMHTGLHWMAAHFAFGAGAVKEHRYWCKRGIFCRLFGGGPETAADQVYCDVSDMRRVWSAFDEIAPVYTSWDKMLRQCYKEGMAVWRDYRTGTNFSTKLEGVRRGVYQTYSGRPIYINAPHAFGNYAIQGTARELLVDGVLKWMEGPWASCPLLPIHDEILTWVPKGEGKAAVAYLKKCMQTRVLSSPGFEVFIDADPDEPFVYWPDSS